MMKRKKWLTCICCLLMMVLCVPRMAFADSYSSDDLNKGNKIAYIDIDTLLDSLSEEAKDSYNDFGSGLAETLKAASDQDAAVKDYFSNHSNQVFEMIKEAIKDIREESNVSEIELRGGTDKEFTKVFEVDSNTHLMVTPTYVCIDKLTEGIIDNNDTPSPAKGTSSTSGTCSKTYYGLIGNVLFTVSVSCSFYYNGSTAWYKGSYNKSYSPGNLAVWRVYNWDGTTYQSGTSHIAYCSGQFRWGFNYEDVGLITQTYDCLNTVKCTCNGFISTSFSNY